VTLLGILAYPKGSEMPNWGHPISHFPVLCSCSPEQSSIRPCLGVLAISGCGVGEREEKQKEQLKIGGN
jgi:hypothetical protein